MAVAIWFEHEKWLKIPQEVLLSHECRNHIFWLFCWELGGEKIDVVLEFHKSPCQSRLLFLFCQAPGMYKSSSPT